MDLPHEWAMCGCRCDLCKAYAPNVEKKDQRKALAQMWNQYYGLDPSEMDGCDGCATNPSDADCPVRKCVLEKGLKHCGDCGGFPCGVFYQRCGSFPEETKSKFDMEEYTEYMLAYDNETRLKEYRSALEQLRKVSEETMRFLRGKYVLDEVGDGKDRLKFRRGGKTVLTIRIRDDRYDFLVIFGKAERGKFEERRHAFPRKIQEIYDNSKTCHGGKWMWIPVADLETLEAVKQLVLMKKKPNRKPFPKEQAVYARCGHRCDLCVHYTGGTISEKFRAELKERLIRVYAGGVGDGGFWGDDMELCDGCHTGGLDKAFGCDSWKCAAENGVDKCQNCPKNPCEKAHHFYQGMKPEIHAKTIAADDVTWTILPYVQGQYGN